MQIEIRDTTPYDLNAIFRIRNDPLVVPNQYRTSLMGTIDEWRDLLIGKVDTGIATFKSPTILDTHTIFGHVTRAHMTSNEMPIMQCGWNLTVYGQ